MISKFVTESVISKKKLLIVDDNPLNLKVLEEHFKGFGFKITICKSGIEAIDICKNDIPDLVLLDIMMPMMDGFQVIDELKKNELTADIPIIFLTARTQTDDIVNGFTKGAVDYIMKPFNPEELTARVTTHLKMKDLVTKLEDQNKKLIELNAEKNHFLGIAAHDMKNPIYSISMLAKSLRDEKNISREDIEDFSNDIINTADRMLILIKDLLDINAIEQGMMKFDITNFDLLESLSSISDIYSERATAKKIKIYFEPRNDSYFIKTDKRAVFQVLDNLISNAIKFSPFGKNIYLEIEETTDTILVSVKDEGPGISSEDKTKLFGKFSKLSAQPTADESSTGLGLSIAKNYVEALGGKIWCESNFGEGAKFIFELSKNI